MRNSLFIFLIGLLISLSSCRNDFEFEPSKGGLTFSKDTVYLDTVFTNIGSSTYRLKVYNKSDSDISIPKIELGKGSASKYRMMIDGLTGEDGTDTGTIGDGKIFNDVQLLAKDSMFIFIEVTADVASANPTDFLYTDQINFIHGNGEVQKVELVTLIQDAIFIYPSILTDGTKEKIFLNGIETELEGHELSGDLLNWTNEKPYVVYGFATVPNGSILNVEQGTNVHFHANSGLIIDKLGTLNIQGELSDYDAEGLITVDREVRFEGDRLEPIFEDVPSQWFGIINFSSNNNSIEYLTLKNATVGIFNVPLDIDDPYASKLDISNSQIYNCSNVGILSRGAEVTGNNLAINNCGQASLACTYGGTYNFTHCTINNNWGSNSNALVLNDYLETDTTLYINNPINNFNFTNCIIYGTNQNELFIERKGEHPFDYNFINCLIRINNTNNNTFYPPTNITNYSSCKIATNSSLFNPKYKDANLNQFNILEDSGAINGGLSLGINGNDILGNPRSTSIDIGAYQFVP